MNSTSAAGFRASFLPYNCMAQIAKTYDELPTISGGISYVQNAANRARNHQPPDVSFEPLSFLFVAYPGKPVQIVLNGGSSHTATQKGGLFNLRLRA